MCITVTQGDVIASLARKGDALSLEASLAQHTASRGISHTIRTKVRK